MKKIYTLFGAGIAAIAMTPVSAAGPLTAGPRAASSAKAIKTEKNVTAKKAPSRIVENGWHSVGTGVWYEGLLTIFDEIEYDMSWEIEVEESDEVAGYYRFVPYHAGSPIAEIVGAADEEYFYLDASDPEKVKSEDFIAYRYFEYNYYFSQIIPENGFYDFEMYGTLENNVVYFPARSFAWYSEELGEFLPVNLEGDFKIVLPGGEVKPNWTTLGISKFTDGFTGPYFLGKAIETEVVVQERERRPGYYRLLDAFSQHGSQASLIIDATDPDFVVVPYTETGIIHEERGETVVYSHCENFISPMKYQNFQEYAEAYPQYVAKMEGRNIVFPPDAIVLHFPEWNVLSFTTNDDEACASSITIPEKAAVDTLPDATPEAGETIYYDLQGRKVANPSAGIYVRRQGSHADKVVIR